MDELGNERRDDKAGKRPVKAYEAGSAKGFSDYAGPFLPAAPSQEGSSQDDPLKAGTAFIIACAENHLNADRRIHGGVLMSLAASAMRGNLGISHPRARFRTISINCDFVAAGEAGARLEGRARIVRATRSVIFSACEILSGERVLLTASGIFEVEQAAPDVAR